MNVNRATVSAEIRLSLPTGGYVENIETQVTLRAEMVMKDLSPETEKKFVDAFAAKMHEAFETARKETNYPQPLPSAFESYMQAMFDPNKQWGVVSPFTMADIGAVPRSKFKSVLTLDPAPNPMIPMPEKLYAALGRPVDHLIDKINANKAVVAADFEGTEVAIMAAQVETPTDLPDKVFTKKNDRTYGDLIPLAEFEECCRTGSFIDYDGYGVALRDGYVAEGIQVSPSDLSVIPKGTTHILWFNK